MAHRQLLVEAVGLVNPAQPQVLFLWRLRAVTVPLGKDRTIGEGNEVREAVSALDADVFYVSGILDRDAATRLKEVGNRTSHDACILILTTFGGDPDAAYIMARFLRSGYPNGFKAFIIGRCKSAGTLLALGAREVVIGSRGELGPLDIQVSEKDEPFRLASGLELFTTLNSLAQNTFTTFETYLLQLIGRSSYQISMKAAAKIATELTVGIMSPISGQIDPLQLGRRERALNIAKAYAERLGVPNRVAGKLATGYPDHGFVIDLEEAKKLLPGKVRAPNDAEAGLETVLSGQAERIGLYEPVLHESPIITLLNPPQPQEQGASKEKTDGAAAELRGDPAGERPEVDGERERHGEELHQADAPH